MPTTAGVGRSIAASAARAGEEAATKACAALGGAPPEFCLVFSTSGYDQRVLLDAVRAVTGPARLSGCSGEGVIAEGVSDERDRSVAVLAVRSDAIRFTPLLVPRYSADPAGAGRALARRVHESGVADAAGLFVFPDGLLGDCTAFLDALAAELPPGLAVAGGAAGDAMLFERTWQFRDGEVTSDAVAAVLVHGACEVAIRVSHGCEPVGTRYQVTDAADGWLRTLDGEPAWAVYRQFLDGGPEDLNAEGIAHLSLAEELETGDHDGYGRIIIRTPLQLDPASGALFFPGGGIRTGMRVRIARRDPVRVRASARSCAERLRHAGAGAQPALVFQFDCAGRGRLMFGPRASDEIVRPLQQILGPATPWLGFHTYGEIAPLRGRPRYHNYTVALCAIFERAPGA